MKSKRAQWIPVVTALIQKNDQVLVGLRPEGKNLAGQWEFPGGKLEAGETPEGALQRELSEELGIEAEIGPLRFASSHSYGDTGILLLFYDVFYWKGEPKTVHHNELRWINPEQLLQLDIPEANRKILPQILKILGKKAS